jgi:plasmid maintenance system killer protein
MGQEPQDKSKRSQPKSPSKPKLFKEKNSSSSYSRKEETPLEMIRRARRELQLSQEKLRAVQQQISEITRLPGNSFREVKAELNNMKQTDPDKWEQLHKEYQHLSQRFGVQLDLFSEAENERADSSFPSKTQRKLIKDRRKWIPMQ